MKIFKICIIYSVLILYPTLLILFSKIESQPIKDERGVRFYALKIEITLYVNASKLATLKIDEVFTDYKRNTTFIKNTQIQTHLPFDEALSKLGQEIPRNSPSSIEEGTTLKQHINNPIFSNKESNSIYWGWKFEIEHLSIMSSDFELTVDKLHIVPGKVGFLYTSLYRNFSAENFMIYFYDCHNNYKKIQANNAKWQLPGDRLHLQHGHIFYVGKNPIDFYRCEIQPRTWDLSNLSQIEGIMANKKERKGFMGIQSKLFSK